MDDDFMSDEEDFINKSKGLLKKNYIFVTKDNRVVIKNLGIRKKSNSPLSKRIFWEYLVPKIKEGQIKFSKAYIRNLMMDLLKEDVGVVAMRKDVGAYGQYAKTSPNSLPAQIAKKYGSGIHFLIINNKGVGVGKGKKYCTLEEYKEHNLRLDNVVLDNVWKELSYFIRPVVVKNIFDYEVKK